MEKLCRICLGEEANIPIFESNENGVDVNSKLSLCVREKVEDIEGYPRNICKSCNNTLDSISLFIKKYKVSYKILERGLLPIRDGDHSDSCNEQSEIGIDLSDLKTEKDSVPETTDVTTVEPGLWNIENLKNLSIKKISSINTAIKNETSTVAESELEGGIIWNGESLKTDIKTPTLRKSAIKIEKQNVKLPKKQKDPQKRKNKKKVPTLKLVTETDNEPKPPKLCDICGDVFSTLELLTYHRKKKHVEKPKPAQCTICGRTCSTEYYLSRHIKRKHSDKKDFACSICTKSFAFKGELTTHIRSIHIKKPPKLFSCKICEKTYKCKKSVIVHERAVHTGERPAVCTVCNASFTHDDYLREHMRLHTGETPFKCPICGRGYAQRCNMKSHLRIHRVSELDAAALSTLRPNYLRRLKA